MKFAEMVKLHVRFIGYQPQGESLIGANLISNGTFDMIQACSMSCGEKLSAEFRLSSKESSDKNITKIMFMR